MPRPNPLADNPDPAPFPNTRLRNPPLASGAIQSPLPSASRPAATPDPESLPASTDPDTCRICRGEGTREEPLFYPCRCSGSIKYVHQDCLMEWLSHSQKKHCELCKTPFRFTKLYEPNMPRALPLNVFLGHMAKYLLRNLVVWFRCALVASVWLGWLPYLMRSIWTFLFWISDQGFVAASSLEPLGNASAATGADVPLSVYGASATVCPSSPLFAPTTTAAALGKAIDQVPIEILPRLFRNLYHINLTLTDPVASSFRLLFGGTASTANSTSVVAQNTSIIPPSRHPSLLSDVAWLRSLTRHPSLNRTVIAILEGQIITVLVIVCFILIILVRDYVVQQQPEINNMRAAAFENRPVPAPAFNHGPQQPDEERREEAQNHAVVEDASDGGEEGDDDADTDGSEVELLPEEADAQAPLFMLPTPLPSPRDHDRGVTDDERARPWAAEGQVPRPGSRPSAAHEHLYYSSDRTPAEVGFARDHYPDSPSSIQPTPERFLRPNLPDAEGTAVHEYLRLYRATGGDLEKIFELAREQGLQDKLEYYIRKTQTVIDRNKQSGGDESELGESSMSADASSSRAEYAVSENSRSALSRQSSGHSSEWAWPGDRDEEGSSSRRAKGKGKQKVEGYDDNDRHGSDGGISDDRDDDPLVIKGTPLRPRSNTDGPAPSGSVNPLANHNWSFAALSSDHSGPSTASTSVPTDELSGSPPQTRPSLLPLDTSHPPESVGPLFDTPAGSARSDAAADWFAGLPPSDVPVQIPSPRAPDPDDPHATQPNIPDFDFNTEPHPNDAAALAAGPQAMNRGNGVVEWVADFMWRGLQRIDPDELEDPDGDEAEFINDENGPFDDAEQDAQEAIARDRDVIEAAVAAGLDPDAIEDAEDFEGIMELLGMRGPVAGLFQNAIFCAFLVSVTVLVGIFVPYNVGRFTLWTVANPIRPARILFSMSKFVQDVALVIMGSLASSLSLLISLAADLGGLKNASRFANGALSGSSSMTIDASKRIIDSFIAEMPIVSPEEMRNFSAISHEALLSVKGHIFDSVAAIGTFLAFLFSGDYSSIELSHSIPIVLGTVELVKETLKTAPQVLVHPSSWVINLSLPDSAEPVDLELAHWGGADRFWAVLSGYAAFSLVAALYLRRGVPFSSSQTGQEWEASVIDGLNQASGVMKVILIIGIEMLVFPLYCGLLLDVALLPLFEGTTVKSRLLFTMNFPLTSIFVHWFVGTGYMFHFALFVSMCRKIMRKGVLYFIRDPDDPEFHPVRDVLERNVTTQLRKILFSAFVYGALVIVCLGGVVWGLSYSLPSVLPIHYSSNEPVLEFPIDLLFYNFLMPLAVKFFKPSDGLHTMYTWWFRKCARALRLTWFLFGERQVDEEGRLILTESPDRPVPFWKKLLPPTVDVTGDIQPRPRSGALFGDGDETPAASASSAASGSRRLPTPTEIKAHLVRTGQIVPNGRFVRAPASDQVKIPKGNTVFAQVAENNPGSVLEQDEALHGSPQFELVYIPPFFRFRVFLFILFIWIFAAATGVGITIVPLVFGRRMFKMLIPTHIRTNDIYAFSIGIYVLGSLTYGIFHAQSIFDKVSAWAKTIPAAVANHHAYRRTARLTLRAARVCYVYSFLLVVFPILVASLMELYLLIPLNTYLNSRVVTVHGAAAEETAAKLILQLNPKHTIRVMQSWTIGLLYLKLGIRIVTIWRADTRLAAACRAVLRRGWFDPDAAILTRAFVIPGLALWAAGVTVPLAFARGLIANGLATSTVSSFVHSKLSAPPSPAELDTLTEMVVALVYRLSFPAVAVLALLCSTLWSLVDTFRGWRVRIRDEAYLIGERLHNFGAVGAPMRGRGTWRAPPRRI